MKQYLDAVQTARLRHLGFPEPKSVSKLSLDIDMDTIPSFSYSLGELIEMLPKQLDNPYKPPLAIEFNGMWRVYYGVPEEYSWEWLIWYEEERNELIDALFDMCIKLKEKGVI